MKLFKSFGIYALTSFVGSAVPFLLLPILTSYLTPEDYGIASYFQVIMKFLGGLFMLGVPACTTIFFFQHDRSEYPKLVKNALIVPTVLGVLVSLLALVLVSQLENLLDVTYFWAILLPILALGELLPNVVLTTLRNMERPMSFAFLNLTKIGLQFGITVVLVIIFDYTWEGILIGVLVSVASVNGLSLGFVIKRKMVSGSIDTKLIKYAFLLGSPLVFQRLGGLMINKSDTLFISEMLGKDILGLYSVAYQIGMVVLLIQDAFGLAWRPFVFKHLKTEKLADKVKIVKVSYLLAAFYLLLPVLLWLVTPLIFDWFINETYHDYMMITPIVALGYSFLGMYKLVTIYIFYLKRTVLITTLTLTSGLLNVIFNYFLIQSYGAIGAAYATVISMLLTFLLTYYISQRVFSMPWAFWNLKSKI